MGAERERRKEEREGRRRSDRENERREKREGLERREGENEKRGRWKEGGERRATGKEEIEICDLI